MHSLMIGLALLMALVWRWGWGKVPIATSWSQRWHHTGLAFVLPPLLLLTTAAAIGVMGSSGHMLGLTAHWLSYWLAIAFLGSALMHLGRISYQAWCTQQRLRAYPQITIAGHQGRLLTDVTFPYSARVGWWQPELLVSQGLLDTLTPEQIEAVLIHEAAHLHYRDTFWTFWLGWLRAVTAWLPHTEAGWQELKTLRELRADRYAAQRVNPLALAESLVAIAQRIQQAPLDGLEESACAILSETGSSSHLVARIEVLLGDTVTPESMEEHSINWFALGLGVLPLLTIPLHG